MTDLDQAADELYAVAPDDFAARRKELASQARAGGDRDLAAKIGKLRKPVQSAALVNTLVRTEADALAQLSTLATELRDAHRHLRGPELRALSERRQQVLGMLTALGRSVSEAAGHPAGEPVLNQLRATFEAAIADEGAEAAVLSGRLTTSLSYSGFGEVDLSDAVAVPVRRLKVVPDPPAAEPEAEPAPTEPDPAIERRRVELERAKAAQDDAAQHLDAAAGRLNKVHLAQERADDQVQKLESQLAAARTAAREAAKNTAEAEREHAKAERAVDRASSAVRRLTD